MTQEQYEIKVTTKDTLIYDELRQGDTVYCLEDKQTYRFRGVHFDAPKSINTMDGENAGESSDRDSSVLYEDTTITVGSTGDFPHLHAALEHVRTKPVSSGEGYAEWADTKKSATWYIQLLDEDVPLYGDTVPSGSAIRLESMVTQVVIQGAVGGLSKLVSTDGTSIIDLFFSDCQNIKFFDIFHIEAIVRATNSTIKITDKNEYGNLLISGISAYRQGHIEVFAGNKTISKIMCAENSYMTIGSGSINLKTDVFPMLTGTSAPSINSSSKSYLHLGGNVTIEDTSTPGALVSCEAYSHLTINGLVIGASVATPSKLLSVTKTSEIVIVGSYTNNSTLPESMNFNEIQYDGSYISDNTGPLVAKDTVITEPTTKTVGTGKDFATLHLALSWVEKTSTTGSGGIILKLDDGIHLLEDFDEWWWVYYKFRNVDLRIESALGVAANCSITIPAADPDNWGAMFQTDSCALQIYNVTIDCALDGSPYAINTDVLWANVSTITLDTIVVKNYSGIHIGSLSYASIRNTVTLDSADTAVITGRGSHTDNSASITNSVTGLSVSNGSSIVSKGTFSGNTADTNIPLNEIQYDGSCISTGTAALSFKA